MIRCSVCGLAYPESGVPYRCPKCRGVFDWVGPAGYDPALVDPAAEGIWRYRHALGLPPEAPAISLGEGNTPLVWRDLPGGRRAAFKLEFTNPSGSYKDRGSAVLLSFLRSRGVSEAIEDSSGNAGASFAAYAAAAGVRGRVYVPDAAAGPKRRQIEAYGAQLVRIMGPRSNAAEAVAKAADEGAVYASHAYLPQVQAGYATLAYELVERLGQAPGTVIVPAGQGNLMLALMRAFQHLLAAGQIARQPLMVGVQALACAPLWALYTYGGAGLALAAEGETLAEGVRVRHPIHGDAVMQTIAHTRAHLLVAEEAEILPGRSALAALGFYVEPTSAIVWSALEQLPDDAPDPVVVVLTGHGLKYAPA